MNFLPRIADGATRVVRLMLVSAVLGLLGLALVEAVAAADPSAVPSASPSILPEITAEPPSPSAQPADLPSPGASLSVALQDTCYTCHSAIDNTQRDIAQKWKDSVHGQNGIGCSGCHGGDPTSDEVTVAMSAAAGYIGTPGRTTTVGVCGNCHSNVERMRQYQLPTDQLVKYRASVHGQRLLSAQDTRVAICIDCHGAHDVKKASDPTAAVYPLNVPKLCASDRKSVV